MTLNNTRNGLFRPWDESAFENDDDTPPDEVRGVSNLKYLRIDVKCERPEDDVASGPSLSPSQASTSQSSGNANEEEEDTLHKLTSLVDRTILGLPSADNSNSVAWGSSSCGETSSSAPSPVDEYLSSPRSAFFPVRLYAYPSYYAFPSVSYAELNQQQLQLRHDIIAGQEHPVDFDHLAAQQEHLAFEEAACLLQHQEALVKQNKKLRPKKFRCPHCDVAFSNNGQLKGHIRIHTGERPFKCDEEGCGKTFTRNEELTRHKRIHSGVRPHACLVCGKCFGRKDHLKKHTRTHDMRGPTIFVEAQGQFPLPANHPSLYPLVLGF